MAKRRSLPALVESETPGRTLWFVATAVAVGALTGVAAASFRLLLDRAGDRRLSLIEWAHQRGFVGFLALVAVCGAAVAAAAALVHRIEPHAEGSGIPRVEGVVEGRIPPGSGWILPVKYVGGLLAIGAGLALGREGPSVQMGGNIGILVSRLTRRGHYDMRLLVASGAAAGLATAFNAPIAGGVFVLEELVKRFDPRTTLATLFASGAGFASAQVLTGGSDQQFAMPALDAPQLLDSPVVLILGVVAGLAGVAYNRGIMASLYWMDGNRLPREIRAGIIGALVGALAYWWPTIVGGGEHLTQEALLGRGGLAAVLAVLACRIVLGIASYAAATPGGLFAPMLVIGSHLGLAIGLVAQTIAPRYAPDPAALALIGTAAFFTSSVRAPITGIVLATELTGATSQLPPMLGACALAMLVATALRDEPIYDALTTRAANASLANRHEAG